MQPITNNQSSSQTYMTQEIIKLSLVSETGFTNFNTEDEDIWIGDSSASSHLTSNNMWMHHIQLIQDQS